MAPTDGHNGNSHPQPIPGQLLPTPSDFPIRWKDAQEQQIFWTLDRMHFPEPITPMYDYGQRLSNQHGFQAALNKYELPLISLSNRFNTYHYGAMVPLMTPDAEKMGRRAEANLGSVMGQLQELWDGEWLPQIEADLRYLEDLNLEGVSLTQLIGIMDEAFERFSHLWKLHFEIVFPSYLPIGIFEDMCRDLFGGEDRFQAHRMLQGLDNLTLDGGRALWSLSRSALAIPEVRQVLEEVAAADVIAALEHSEPGRAFLEQLRNYLQEYGRRTNDIDFSGPSWIEDPTSVIKALKDYVGQPDRDWYAERRKLISERDAAIAAARARLQGYPREVAGQFEFFLRAAQTGVVLSEDHNFLIDFQGNYAIRRVLLAVGKALVGADIIAERDDVFFLTPDEIKAAVRTHSDQRSIVAERKAEMAHFRQVVPPPAVGTLPPGPPPDNAFTRTMMGKFFGQPVEQPAEAGTIRGYAGSPGVARGVARVVRSFADTSRVQQGEILVAETTAPPWTPLFASVIAVVTDTGAVLSHSAVVAREYGIPAVVGTGIGTTAIHDGQMIEVDGNTGLVRILETA